MGALIFIAFAALFLFGIFSSTGVKRLLWFFTGTLFFSDRIMLFDVPTKMSFDRFLVYSLFLAELINPKEFLLKLKYFPFLRSLLLFLIGLLLVGLFDNRIGIFLKLYRPLDYFLQTTFVAFLCYANITSERDWAKVVKFLLWCSFILGVYGLYNFFTQTNPLDHFITSIYQSVSPFDDYVQGKERFRINSFVSHPIYYGYLCGILLLLSFYTVTVSRQLRKLCFILMPLILANLIFANSRTPLLAFALGLLTFIILALRKTTIFIIGIVLIVVSIGAYTIPFVSKKVNITIDGFKNDGGATSGSNLGMRMTQLQASYAEFKKKPVFGNGLYYIEENLGWSNVEEQRMSDPDFEGFESYVYQLLIEQGLAGILTTLIFVINIGIYFLSKRRTSKEISILGLSVLIMFIVFVTGTGTLHSWIISMGLIGVCVRTIEFKRRKTVHLQSKPVVTEHEISDLKSNII